MKREDCTVDIDGPRFLQILPCDCCNVTIRLLLAHSSNFLATKYLLRMNGNVHFMKKERKKERMGYYLKFGINGEFVKVIKIYLIFLSKFDR